MTIGMAFKVASQICILESIQGASWVQAFTEVLSFMVATQPELLLLNMDASCTMQRMSQNF